MFRKSLIALAGAMGCAIAVAPAVAQTRVVAPGDLAGYWVLTNTYVDADVPNSGHGLDAPGCAAVSYTIGSDGVTRDVKVRKVVPSTSDFSLTASSVIRQFRYAPTADNAAQVPVSTYYIVPFNLPDDAAERQRITHACDLPGYHADSAR